MKANELMIGDWVMYNLKPVHVNGTNYDGGIDVDRIYYFADEDEISPIPLSEEILKENNFVCINGDWCYGSFYFSTRRDRSYYINIAGQKVTIECVHELQHALRLCGLNELADNFKITHN